MGRKITVDSATLMNKAFEVIEAHWLFDMPWECIDVVIHSQSIVHSLVEFQDGSVKAQMAPPDMRLPLQYAMFYPERVRSEWIERLDFARVGSLDFEPMDQARYPCFAAALDAAKKGGTYPAALCGADEAAVTLFLDGKIGFMDIPDLIRRVIEEHRPGDAMSLDDVIGAESWARRRAQELVPASR
jgi:1-deoxy-D-xylulose-5-phosphate reductoisomerase